MPVQSLDVARIRGLYPTVGGATVHLDGPLSALAPEAVIRAIITTLRSAPARPGSVSVRSRRAAASEQRARQAIADLTGAAPEDVLLGSGVAQLLERLVPLVSQDWRLGDEVVLSRLDADEQIRPWLRAATAALGVVRWAEVDLETGELPAWQYEQLVGRRTRLVTVPLGNPGTGTVPDASAIAARAHQHGALVVVDAGVALPYLPVDLAALGADLLTLDLATMGGPHVAAVAARPGLLAEMGAERADLDSAPIELLDGITATVDHFAGLDLRASGSRRERIGESLHALTAHLAGLYAELDEALRGLPGVSVLGGTDRLPVAAVTADGFTPGTLARALADRGVSVWSGPHGHAQLMHAYGADEIGGAAFLGLMPYTNRNEVLRLLDALAELVRA